MGFWDSFADGLGGGLFIGALVGILWGVVKVFRKKENGGENKSIPMAEAVQTTTKTPVLSVRTNAAHEKTITQQVALQAIEKLADLKMKGILTEEEFLQKKRELLDVI